MGADELHSAHDNCAGTLARRFETNLAVAGIHGIEALLHRVEPFGEAIDRVRAVRGPDLLQAALTYLNGKGYLGVTIGPL